MEFEFAGVEIEDVANLIAELFGGAVVEENAFIYRVEGTAHGDFQVEVDSAFLKEERYKPFLELLDLSELAEESLKETLRKLSGIAVPMEVVTPPIEMDSIYLFEELRAKLRQRKALGTNASFIYAFGLHINPEAASLDARYLLNILRAFFILFRELLETSDVDPTRRLTPYIDTFPERYVRKVLASDYHPGIDELIDDYLVENPTRNRALDMLPIFAHLDLERVKAGVKEPDLVNARPAFHYRLPNCRIDEDDWSVAEEWNRWAAVEKLADDEELLKEQAGVYLADRTSIGDWLKDLFR